MAVWREINRGAARQVERRSKERIGSGMKKSRNSINGEEIIEVYIERWTRCVEK